MEKASFNQIKLLRKLSRKKYRDQLGLFLLEGERAVRQALENEEPRIHSIYIEEEMLSSYDFGFSDVFEMESRVFREIAGTENPQGVIAVCEMPGEVTMEEIAALKSGIVVALDRIQDPGNLGTIIRTAGWFGVKALLAEKGTVDVFNPKVARSTVGSLGSFPILYTGLNAALALMEQKGWQVVLLDGNPGALPIRNIVKSPKMILVTGNEANGISPALITANRQRVMIPRSGLETPVESLNAAVAAGIALFYVAE